MDYVTKYYKNLCEELQSRIDLLEAGLKKAMKSGNRQRMEKELARQKFRKKAHQEQATKHAGISPRSPRYAAHQLAAETHRAQAASLGPNIEDLAMQLDYEYPLAKSRVTPSELTHESPFGTDVPEAGIPGPDMNPYDNVPVYGRQFQK